MTTPNPIDKSCPTCGKVPASTPHMCDLEVSEVREKINKLLNSALHRPLTRTEHQVVIESIAAILHQQDQEFIKTLLSQDRLRLTQEIEGKIMTRATQYTNIIEPKNQRPDDWAGYIHAASEFVALINNHSEV